MKNAETDGYVDGAATPLEQLDTFARRFVSGEDFVSPFPHLMRPEENGIWRLITPDLRIVGWFPERSVFVASEVDFKKNCDVLRDNALYLNAVQMRESLNIGGACFVSGDIDECI